MSRQFISRGSLFARLSRHEAAARRGDGRNERALAVFTLSASADPQAATHRRRPSSWEQDESGDSQQTPGPTASIAGAIMLLASAVAFAVTVPRRPAGCLSAADNRGRTPWAGCGRQMAVMLPRNARSHCAPQGHWTRRTAGQ
jgi:hypothetical protein